MRPTAATRQIKSFRASTLKLYLILIAIGGRAGVDDLHNLSGLSKPTIKSALDELKFSDPPLVTQTSRYQGWVLTLAGQQLILSAETSQKVFDSPISINSDLNKDISLLENTTTSGGNEKTFDSLDPEILELLHANGIFDPKARELAAMPHITKEYIILHVSKSKENGGSLDLPLIIWKMVQCQPAPPRKPSVWDGWEPCDDCGTLTCNPPLCITCEEENEI